MKRKTGIGILCNERERERKETPCRTDLTVSLRSLDSHLGKREKEGGRLGNAGS